jgi:hypothetical protein
VLNSWIGCTPISEIDSYTQLLSENQNIPEDATCFSTGHMQNLTFYSFPDIENSRLLLSALILSFITVWVLILPSTLRMLKRWRS